MSDYIVITGKGSLVRDYVNKNKRENDITFPENSMDVNEQAEFLSNISPDFKGRIFTFSPWIISDADNNTVYKVNEDLTISLYADNTFGSSIHLITKKVLGRKYSISKRAVYKIKSYQEIIKTKKICSDEEIDKFLENIDKDLCESIHKTILLKSFL